jgi:hypothetical protein
MNTLKIWERLSMEVTGSTALMGGTRASKAVSPPMGVGMVARIGDRSAQVVLTVMGVVLGVRIAEVEEVTIIGTTNAIWGRPRLPLPPVTQRARIVKGKTPGTLHDLHVQTYQGVSQHRETMMFP